MRNEIDWTAVAAELDGQGVARLGPLLAPAECRALVALYPQQSLFRSRVVMARHGFGRGEYQYFAHPLPDVVQALRSALYPRLVPVANRWNEAMGLPVRYPAEHGEFLARCHA